MSGVEFLCIGHACHDKTTEGFILGGTVSYASMIARKLGMSSKVVTSVGKDFLFEQNFTDLSIPLMKVPANLTTVFENIYSPAGRIQHLLAKASVIRANDIPKDFKSVPIVLFGPIADEIDNSVFDLFDKPLKCATIQGFVRSWDSFGLIQPKSMDWSLLSKIDITFLSEDDIKGIPGALSDITQNCNHVVVTKGNEGAIIYQENEEYFFPSLDVIEKDATGAGDVFTTAYILEFYNTGDIKSACIFAHCAASFAVEGIGLSKLPQIEEIRIRENLYRDRYF